MFFKPTLAIELAQKSDDALEIFSFVIGFVALFESLGGIAMYENIY